jgi:hypothetical protein
MMTTPDLDRLAGSATWLALVALVLSGIALALFFGGAGSFWGPVNDVLIVVTAIALIPAVLAVDRAAGDHGAPWTRIVTVAALAGLVLMAAGQSLLVAGRLSLEGSYVTGGIGVIPFVAWMVLVAALSLASGVLPATVGWLAVAALAAIVAEAVVATLTQGPPLWIASVALLVVLAAWLAALATALSSSVVASQA